MTTRTSRPISGSAVAGSAPADIVDIAGGYFAEKRGGLHMALPPEIAMVNAIAALRAELKELDALKVDIANALADLTDCSIENDALRARVAELGSADTCGRVCEGTAYRLEARSLRAKVDELEQDAARYRWLRDEAPRDIGDMASVRDHISTADIDAAIDAARRS